MATCEESVVTKRRSDFVSKMEFTVTEIKNKFIEFHNDLFRKEAKLSRIVQKIQQDTLEKFDDMLPRLNEIEKGRESLISILTSNSNQQLLDTNLHSFSSEIDKIIGKSRIDRIIELKWKGGGISIDDICQIKVNISVDSSTQEILHRESSGNSKNQYSSRIHYRKFHGARSNRCVHEYSPYHHVKSPNVIRNPRKSQSMHNPRKSQSIHNPRKSQSIHNPRNLQRIYTPRKDSSPIQSPANTNMPESSDVNMDNT